MPGGRPRIVPVDIPTPAHYTDDVKRRAFKMYCEQKIVNFIRLAQSTQVPIEQLIEWKERDGWVALRGQYYQDQLNVLYKKVQRPEICAQSQLKLAKRMTELINNIVGSMEKTPSNAVPSEVRQLSEAMLNLQKYQSVAYQGLKTNNKVC